MNDYSDDKEEKSQGTLRILSFFLFTFIAWITFNNIVSFMFWATQFFPGILGEEELKYLESIEFWKEIILLYNLTLGLSLFVLSLKLLKGSFWTIKWLKILLGIDVLVYLVIVIIFRITEYHPKIEEGFEVGIYYTIIEAIFLILLNHPRILEQTNQEQKA